MRLTCPNCGAQYEVPDEVIPETGRDVQCSNCGDTWFQPHRDHVPEHAEDAAPESGDWDEPEAPTAPPPPAAEDFAPPPGDEQQAPEAAQADAANEDASGEAAPTPDARAGGDEPDENAEQQPAQSSRPERREIDPSVASVLREEAEREKRARAAAQGGIETQPDLGLTDDEGESRRQREARQRMARMRGLDDDRSDDRVSDNKSGYDAGEDDLVDIDPKSRRSLFPDIEEINSSLGPEPVAYGAAGADRYPEADPRPRGGFRRGFLLAILAAVLALVVYVFAAPLAGRLPALEGVLADYVVWVDGLRVWLDGQIAAIMLWLDGLVAPTPGGDGG
jgi:predicted Zn finger-like uncharacterized protein